MTASTRSAPAWSRRRACCSCCQHLPFRTEQVHDRLLPPRLRQCPPARRPRRL